MPKPESIDDLVSANTGDFDPTVLFKEDIKQEPDVDEADEVKETEGEEQKPDDEGQEGQEETDKKDTDEGEEQLLEGSEAKKEEVKDTSAFIAMRKKIAELEGQLAKQTGEQIADPLLVSIAQSYGYTDVEKFRNDYVVSQQKKEAEAKGIDPEVYAQMKQQEQRIASLEQDKLTTAQETRLVSLKQTIDKIVTDNALTQQDVEDMFTDLEKQGFTVESLLGLPNFEVLIKGALSDKIFENKSQKSLEKEKKLAQIAGEPLNPDPINEKFDVDSFIKKSAKEIMES